MAVVRGMDCKLYLADTPFTGSDPVLDYAAATYTEVDNVDDNTLNLEAEEMDATTRGNNGWTATIPGLKDGSSSFEMVWNTADPNFQAIQDAWLNGTEIGLAILDGDYTTSGNQGLAGNFTVPNFTRTEELRGVAKAQVTVRPSSYNDWWVIP